MREGYWRGARRVKQRSLCIVLPAHETLQHSPLGIRQRERVVPWRIMALERGNGRERARDVVAQRGEHELVGNARRHRLVGRIAPDAEAACRQCAPREIRAGIDLAPGGNIAVSEKVRRRDLPAGLEIREQPDERVDQRRAERLGSVIVELDPDRRGVDIAVPAPKGLPRMPCTLLFVDEIVNTPVPADQIVGADSRNRIGESGQRAFRESAPTI